MRNMLPCTPEETRKRIETIRKFYMGCRTGNIHWVKYCIESKKISKSTINRSLEAVSKLGHLRLTKYLVSQGADVLYDNSGALRWACHNNHIAIVKFLTKSGADVTSKGNWAIKMAAYRGHLDVVKFLIKNGADPHAGKGGEEITVVDIDESRFDQSIKAKVVVNQNSVISAACNGYKPEIVEYLLGLGVDIYADDKLAFKQLYISTCAEVSIIILKLYMAWSHRYMLTSLLNKNKAINKDLIPIILSCYTKNIKKHINFLQEMYRISQKLRQENKEMAAEWDIEWDIVKNNIRNKRGSNKKVRK